MKKNRLAALFRMDARIIFLLAALIGAGSLFVTTFTNEAEETEAADAAKAGTKEIQEGAPAEGEKAEAKDAPKAAVATAAPAAKFDPKKSCLTGEAAIQDAQDLKASLAKKEQELKRREEEITQKEQAVQEELKNLETVRDEIKNAQSISNSKNEEKISKLVETLESMSPKSAAAIVSNVDERLAVEAMNRLTSPKLGKILAAMDAAKSAALSEKLAGVVRAKRSTASTGGSLGAAETAKSVKGGEENGNHKQSNSDAVAGRQPEPALGREPASEKR